MSAPTLSRTPVSPPASRAKRPGWRDPRLAVGVGLVALCALLGARIVGSADNSVPVWSARTQLVAGHEIEAGDLRSVRIRFGSAHDADRYLGADAAVEPGTVVTRDIGAGELVPRGALGARSDSDLVEVPVTVPSSAMPATLRVGDDVDVWVAPKTGGPAVAVLSGVRVLALPVVAESLSPSVERQLIVGLVDGQHKALPAALGSLASGSVVVTRVVR